MLRMFHIYWMNTAEEVQRMTIELDKRRADEAEYREKLRIAEARLEEQRERLQRTVQLSANPSPVLLAGIFVGVLLVMWVVHVMFIKPSMSGMWYEAQRAVHVDHNRLTGVLRVVYDGQLLPDGLVVDNLVNVGGRIGVWDYRATVYMLDGGIWQLANVPR